VPNQEKIMPSEGIELSKITGRGMISGDKIFIYETQFGNISVLICRDFGNFIERLTDKIDIVFVPSYNSAPERFEEIANSHVSNHPSYIIISNSAIFGGTSIFGQMDKVYFPQLVQAGFKDKESNNYKLCEIKKGKEGIIIANLNIMYKQIQKPTPINPDEAKRSVEYIKILDIKVDKNAD
jgi:predicted amidohydrolase